MINNTYYNGKQPPKYFINNKQVRSMYLNNNLIYNLVPCKNIELNAKEIVLTNTADNSFLLTIKISPSNCNEEVKIISSNTDVAVVNRDGSIHPIQVGVCDIIVTCGEVTATCKVNVKEEVVYLYNRGVINNESAFGQMIYPSDGYSFNFDTDNIFLKLAGVDNNYGTVWFSWANELDLGEYDILHMDILNNVEHSTIIGLTRNSISNQQGYQEGQNTIVDGDSFVEDRTIISLLQGENKHSIDVDLVMGTGYLGLYFKRETSGDSDEDFININTIYLVRKSSYIIGSGIDVVPEAKYPCTGLSFNNDVVEIVYNDQPVLYDLKDVVSISPINCDEPINWEVIGDDDNIIELFNDGTINIIGKGSAKIQAVCGVYFDSVTVSTRKPCEQLELNVQDLSFETIGESKKITATVLPIDTTDIVVWKTTDENVVSVDQNGNVVSTGVGQCQIYAECGSKFISVPVVVGISCTGIELSQTDCVLDLSGEKVVILNPVVTPIDTTDMVEWESTDIDIVNVNNGTITAVGIGTATVIATCGTKSATCNITVEASCTSLSLNLSEMMIDMSHENNGVVNAIIEPINTTDEIIWTSHNTNVITVENGTVTPIGFGTANITATCGTQSATCSVTVKASCTEISLNQSSYELDLSKTSSLTITPTITPSNTTDTLVWKSNNNSIVTVVDGVITAVGVGTATITALCGTKMSTCEINVIKSCTGITLSHSTYSLNLNGTTAATFTATVTPSDTTDAVVWTSSNTSVATVNPGSNELKGTVTAKSTGIATITATCGTKSATLKVTVTDRVPCTGISVSPTSATINVGDFIAFNSDIMVSVSPSNCTDSVSFRSSNDDILDPSITTSGVYKGYSAGTATLTATCGNYSASCRVTVVDPSTLCTGMNVWATPSNTIKVGEEVYINIDLIPSTCTEDYTISVSGSAIIGQNGYAGLYIGTAVGSATVTVRCGNISKSITINVTE